MNELRVKIKALASEARIIRHETERVKGFKKNTDDVIFKAHWERKTSSLNHHRKFVVGNEARVSLLAYAFLRGVPYKSAEPHCKQEPDWDRVWDIARRFGGLFRVDVEKFEAWKNLCPQECVS